MRDLTRRGFLKLATGSTLGIGLGLGIGQTPGRTQGREIPMLGLFPYTGAFADVGPFLERGMRLALEERSNSVLGRPVKLLTRDSATNAGTATRRAEDAVEQDGVKFIIGPWSSGVALAVTEVAKRRHALEYFSGGTEDIAGARCHRYAFQWAAHPYTAAKTVVEGFLAANPGARRWYLLVADYAFGWSVEKYVRAAVGRNKGEVIGRDYHPLGEREFSGLVTKAAGAKPDVIAFINFGSDAVQGVRETFNFGFTPRQPVIMTWSSGVEELQQLKPEMRANLWVGTNFYYTIDTPLARAFVKRYREKYNQPPGYAPAAAYGMTRIVLGAIERARSAEVRDVIQAMEGWEFTDLLGQMKILAANHQTLRPYFFLRCNAKDQMKDEWDFGRVLHSDASPQPAALNECKGIGSL